MGAGAKKTKTPIERCLSAEDNRSERNANGRQGHDSFEGFLCDGMQLADVLFLNFTHCLPCL